MPAKIPPMPPFEEGIGGLGIPDVFNALGERLMGMDDQTLREIRARGKSLEALCSKIESEKSRLNNMKVNVKKMFSNPDDFANGNWLDFKIPSFFLELYTNLSKPVVDGANYYLMANEIYQNSVKRVLDKDDVSFRKSPSAGPTAAKINEIITTAVQRLMTLKLNLPGTMDIAYKKVYEFNKYLKDRFVENHDKDDDKNSGSIKMRFLVVNPESDSGVDYVKIKLFENNPVLTDILLELIDILPKYREVEVKEGKKSKKVKEISRYSLDSVADTLMLLSDPMFLEYVKEPKKFFENLGGAVEEYYRFFQELSPIYEKILTQVQEIDLGNLGENPTQVKELLTSDYQNINKKIKRFKGSDMDLIVQKEEDILPENKKEKDQFRLREDLMKLLYNSMNKISALSTSEEKERLAKETILEAVEIKKDIEELLISADSRKIRKDKETDNEYYEGKQGEIGHFYFEREPAPQVKLDDVIGASFDKAKNHLNSIIDTALYPHVTTLSAPGRKVRSNILLIGSYGCGKTELARAICGDKRIIGASVNVARALTAYIHESVNNVQRIYDAAKQLYLDGRELKPVVLILDEFDSWFSRGDHGGFTDIDMQQIETILLQVLDGMSDYKGIVTLAMTNKPVEVPKGILRRFREVDVVGELTNEERAYMLKMYLETSLPTQEIPQEKYLHWAKKLTDAPGDVVRKVVDEIHGKLITSYIKTNPSEASKIERLMLKREIKHGLNDDKDVSYIKNSLGKYKIITPDEVEQEVNSLIIKPDIAIQINEAKEMYANAKNILSELSTGDKPSFGFGTKDKLFGIGEKK